MARGSRKRFVSVVSPRAPRKKWTCLDIALMYNVSPQILGVDKVNSSEMGRSSPVGASHVLSFFVFFVLDVLTPLFLPPVNNSTYKQQSWCRILSAPWPWHFPFVSFHRHMYIHVHVYTPPLRLHSFIIGTSPGARQGTPWYATDLQMGYCRGTSCGSRLGGSGRLMPWRAAATSIPKITKLRPSAWPAGWGVILLQESNLLVDVPPPPH